MLAALPEACAPAAAVQRLLRTGVVGQHGAWMKNERHGHGTVFCLPTCRRTSNTTTPAMSARHVSWLEVAVIRDWLRTHAAMPPSSGKSAPKWMHPPPRMVLCLPAIPL